MEHLFQFKSQSMGSLIKHLESIADSDIPILLYGETGTGKNVFAEYLHQNSKHQNGLFVRIDCAELSRTLLESELFGHEKGAFTGAMEKKVGYLDMVCGGTLFLDEIENLDHESQIKLLNVLDTGQFRRIGGREVVTTGFRLISATNVDIEKRVGANQFRKDFYYRLKGHKITIPPLRERRNDIRLLIDFFLEQYGRRYNRKSRITHEAMSCLLDYDWPGNIRELRMLLASALVSSHGARIELEHLPLEIQRGALLATAKKEQWTAEAFLQVYIKQLLKLTGNNKTKTANVLGWTLNRLKRHMQKMDSSK